MGLAEELPELAAGQTQQSVLEEMLTGREEGAPEELVHLADASLVLCDADGRLNKEPLPRNQYRGVPRYAAPQGKSLLCNPGHKSKSSTCKKASSEAFPPNQSVKKNVKTTIKGNSTRSVDERATTLLLKTSALVTGSEPATAAIHEQFGGQFVGPMDDALVGGMRTVFGISTLGAPLLLMPWPLMMKTESKLLPKGVLAVEHVYLTVFSMLSFPSLVVVLVRGSGVLVLCWPCMCFLDFSVISRMFLGAVVCCCWLSVVVVGCSAIGRREAFGYLC